MKKKDLIKYLLKYGCVLEREGKKHSLFYNPNNKNHLKITVQENERLSEL